MLLATYPYPLTYSDALHRMLSYVRQRGRGSVLVDLAYKSIRQQFSVSAPEPSHKSFAEWVGVLGFWQFRVPLFVQYTHERVRQNPRWLMVR
jgi:hypothetical protein